MNQYANMEKLKELKQKANRLPLDPGVYIMKDKKGGVIYVGKSRKLKNRVSQYFQNSEKNQKTANMVRQVKDFDYYLCDTAFLYILIKDLQYLASVSNQSESC